jgi:hypothetical protein
VAAETGQKPKSSWRPILPVPDDAPAPSTAHPQRGEPFKVHEYRDAEQRLLGYVCQFRRSAGGIHKLTLTWCENEEDKRAPGAGSSSRRCARVPRRSARCRAAEHRADRRRRVVRGRARLCRARCPRARSSNPERWPFIAYDVVSWPGGRSKLGEVDWSCCKGRVCAIWLPHSAERYKVAKGDPQAGALIRSRSSLARRRARAEGHADLVRRDVGGDHRGRDDRGAARRLGSDPRAERGWDHGRLHEWVQLHFATCAELPKRSGSPRRSRRRRRRSRATGPLRSCARTAPAGSSRSRITCACSSRTSRPGAA